MWNSRRRRRGGNIKLQREKDAPRAPDSSERSFRRTKAQRWRFFAVFLATLLLAFTALLPSMTPANSDSSSDTSSLRKPSGRNATAMVSRRGAAAPPERDVIDSKIPRILSFTHYVNLLNPNLDQTLADNDKIPDEDKQELLALKSNIRESINLLKPLRVNFLTNDQCIDAIRRVRGANSSLASHFETESEGMYKADICRGAILYETGGIYLDVDVGIRMNLFDTLQHGTTFATVLVHRASKHPGGFFQAFIATVPQSSIIYRYLELFEEFYEGKVDVNGPLGVLLLRRAYDEMVEADPEVARHSELWQEVKYEPSYRNNVLKHVPPPVWGVRRACKFVVVTDLRASPLVVPMYSRVGGSRMCPLEPEDSRYLSGSGDKVSSLK